MGGDDRPWLGNEREGGPYNNTYCIVAHVVDGRFDELTDYVDTELISRALFGATE